MKYDITNHLAKT